LSLELSLVAAHDLGLDEIIAAFTPDREHQKEIRDLFSRLPCDPDVIAYRQAVLEDLLANPELAERVATLLPVIDSLFEHSHHMHREMTWLHEVVWRAGELQNMMDCFEGMGGMLRSVEGRIHSEGLRSLQEEIRKAQNDPKYQSLVRELPGLLAKLQGCASVTVGVNLDASLRPIQATLLSVNEKPFTDQSLLNRLFGLQNDQEGIAPLHSVPQRMVEGPYAFPIDPKLWAKRLDGSTVCRSGKSAGKPPPDQKLRQYAGLHGKHGLRRHALYPGATVHRRFQNWAVHALPDSSPGSAAGGEGLHNVPCAETMSWTRYWERKRENDIPLGPDGRILI
jgi:hypothetical protein